MTVILKAPVAELFLGGEPGRVVVAKARRALRPVNGGGAGQDRARRAASRKMEKPLGRSVNKRNGQV
jgi:hypothetical protein